MEELKCKNCGATIDIRKAVDGVIECDYCMSVFTLPRQEASEKVVEYLNAAERAMDVCHFDDAFSYYKLAVESDENEPQAYFGMALATFKVQFLKDYVNNRLQPICHAYSEKKFVEDKNYLKAIDLATEKQKHEYKKIGREIDEIQEEFAILEESNLDYDCFICVKVTEKDGITKTADYDRANEIYYYLKENGYKPFFSEREIKGQTGSAYEAMILYALIKSECMLIVCSNEEYLQTRWVKNEYFRFMSLLSNDEKDKDALTFVYYHNPIERLPNGTKKIQGIDYSGPTASEMIKNYVDRHTPEAKKRKEEVELAKIREEERQKRIIREKEELSLIKKKVNDLSSSGNATVSTLLTRANQHLSYAEFEEAEKYFNWVLDASPKNIEAWWGLFLCDNGVVSEDKLIEEITLQAMKGKLLFDTLENITNNRNYQTVIKYANENIRIKNFRDQLCEVARKSINQYKAIQKSLKQVQVLVCEKEVYETKIQPFFKPFDKSIEKFKTIQHIIQFIIPVAFGVLMLIFYLFSFFSPYKTPWQAVWKIILFFIPDCKFKDFMIYDVTEYQGFMDNILCCLLISICVAIVVRIIISIIFFPYIKIKRKQQKNQLTKINSQIKEYGLSINLQGMIEKDNKVIGSIMNCIISTRQKIKNLKSKIEQLNSHILLLEKFISSNAN